MDVRSKDSIRAIEKTLVKQAEEIVWLREHIEMLLTLTRAIKKSTVRKWNKK